MLLLFIGRQYGQDTIGVQGLMLSWSGILVAIVMGRYEQTIVIARSSAGAIRLWHISLALAVLGSIVIAVVALGLDLLWISNPLGGFIHWIAPYVLVTAVANATMMLLLRQKVYTRLGIAQGLRTISNNLIKAILGFYYPSTLTLIGSSLAASVIGAIPLWRYLRQVRSLLWDRRYWAYLRHYRAFPLLSTPQALLNTFTGSLLVVMLPLGYGMKEVGLITMVVMLVRRPILVLSDSVGQVYFERMSRLVAEGTAPLTLIKRLIVWTSLSTLAIYAIAYLTIDWAICLLLGEGWAELPYIILCMLPYLGANFLSSILNVLPDILGKQRIDLMARLVRLALESGAIYIGMQLYTFKTFVAHYYLMLFALELLYVGVLVGLASRHRTHASKA